MRILMGGGTGYLGRKLHEKLSGAGHLVQAVTGELHRLKRPGCRVPIPEELADQQFDLIINCAGCYGRKNESIPDIIDANLMFPASLLDFALKHQVKNFINCSSSINKRINFYSISKNQFSEYGQFCGEFLQLKFVDCVIEHFYGPREDPDNNFIAGLLDKFKKQQPEILLTPGEQLRDFIYIDDLVNAFVTVIQNLDALPEHYTALPVGSARTVRIREVAEIIKRELDADSQLRLGAIPYRPNELMYSCADTTWLRRHGWTAQYSFEDGIRKIMKEEGLI